MVSALALFPLKTVVFPGEMLPLHIFEERYRELIYDCEILDMTFGIPAYIGSSMEYGTEVKLEKVVETYPDSSKDVICRGLQVFRIEEFTSRQEGRKYGGGTVHFLENIENGTAEQLDQFKGLIKELYVQLEIPPPKKNSHNINSYTLSHKIGLSLEQEYTLLKLLTEKERLEFLINHLSIIIPVVQELNRTRTVIEMNGHFKKFDPLDFEDYKIEE
ncbi:LON peptidase substrate-binding domain-containing protein [Salinimicrobium marinum]|nr:LON peptidase substrate-binding domain-containing protein [Salinimicrobium marinum]